MVHRRHDRPDCCAVTLQLVCDEAKRELSLILQKLAKESRRCTTVASRLDKDVDHVAVLIHSTPKILPLTFDCDEHFVQEPRIAEATLPLSQSPCIIRTELPAPAPDCLVGDHDSSFRQQIFNIPEAEAESVVEPDCVADDLRRESVSMITGSAGFHAQVWQMSGQVDSALHSPNLLRLSHQSPAGLPVPSGRDQGSI